MFLRKNLTWHRKKLSYAYGRKPIRCSDDDCIMINNETMIDQMKMITFNFISLDKIHFVIHWLSKR